MIFIITTDVSLCPDNTTSRPPLAPRTSRQIEARRVRPIGRRSRSGQCLNAQESSIGVSGMAETSRDSPAAHIPQRVSARTGRAGRSGTRRARGFGGRGAPVEWLCLVIFGRAGTCKCHSENLCAICSVRRDDGLYICHHPVADKKMSQPISQNIAKFRPHRGAPSTMGTMMAEFCDILGRLGVGVGVRGGNCAQPRRERSERKPRA